MDLDLGTFERRFFERFTVPGATFTPEEVAVSIGVSKENAAAGLASLGAKDFVRQVLAPDGRPVFVVVRLPMAPAPPVMARSSSNDLAQFVNWSVVVSCGLAAIVMAAALHGWSRWLAAIPALLCAGALLLRMVGGREEFDSFD